MLVPYLNTYFAALSCMIVLPAQPDSQAQVERPASPAEATSWVLSTEEFADLVCLTLGGPTVRLVRTAVDELRTN